MHTSSATLVHRLAATGLHQHFMPMEYEDQKSRPYIIHDHHIQQCLNDSNNNHNGDNMSIDYDTQKPRPYIHDRHLQQCLNDSSSNNNNNNNDNSINMSLANNGNYRSHHNNHTRHLSHSTGKAKRVRTIFTPQQLERLEHEFSIQMYLVGIDRLKLAKSLGLSEAQVKVWFQNRRIKFRKLNPSPFLSISKSFEDNNTTSVNNGMINNNTAMSNNSASSLSYSDNYSSI